MNIAGAIHAAGSRPIKDFAYGEVLVNMINSLTNFDPPITTETTGKQIIHLLDQLPDNERNVIMSYPISIVDENGDFIIEKNIGTVNPKVVLMVSVGMLMVMLAGILSYSQIIAINKGSPSDANAIVQIFQVLGDIIKTVITTK